MIGREESAHVRLPERSVSRQHARITAGQAGYVLQDLGSTYGSFVHGMRVRNVTLKDGDGVQFGKVQLIFRDGGLSRASASTRRVPADRFRTRALPLPLVNTLVKLADRRGVVYLLEAMKETPPDQHAKMLREDRKSTRLNSSHDQSSYAVFCL